MKDENAYVWIDPARRSGEPCVGGVGVGVDMVVGAVWSSSVENAMDLWCLTRGQVLVACWYAGAGFVVRLHDTGGRYAARRGPWRKRWGAWAADVHQALWDARSVDYDAIGDPPTEAGAARRAALTPRRDTWRFVAETVDGGRLYVAPPGTEPQP